MGIFSPYWKYVTPTGMIEPTERVTYTHDGLDFTVWVWKQYGEVTDGTETATVKARNTAGGGTFPQNLVTEGTVRYTAEAIFPLGTLWKRRVIWSDNTEDTGNLLMFLAKTGYLNTYYTDAPANRAFWIDGTNNWANPLANIYTLGNLRVRVVKGTAGLVGTRITVTPDGDNKVQIMIYNRSVFDGYTLNEMGNTTTTVADEISQVAGYYKEIHMRVVDSDMGIDRYMAVNPVNSESEGLLVKLYRDGTHHTVFFGVTGADFSQQFLVERIVYKGARDSDITNDRKYKYTTKADYVNPRFRSQTYNSYPVISGTSWTFWTISRVLQPITFKYYKVPDEILLLYFPQTNADFAEDDAGKVDFVTTKAVWVLSHYKLIAGFKYTNNVFFDIKGTAGNSICGGWRHSIYSLGGKGDVKYKNAGAWTHVANISNADWTYQAGEAIWGISPESTIRYFTMMRHWSGWAEAKSDLVPYIGDANSLYASLMKNIGDADNRAADSVSKHGMCVVFQEDGTIPSAAEGNTLISDYTHPVGVAFEDGLVDLDAGTPDTNLSWDVGYDGSGDPQIFGEAVITTGDVTDIGKTTATGHGNIVNTGGENCDKTGCEWGLVSGGPYPNSVTTLGNFGVGPFTCNLTGLSCDTIIYYRTKAHNSSGWGYGSEKSFRTDCCVVLCVNYGIRIRWNDNATNETAYYVERDDGGWHVIATLPANTTEYLDVNVKCNVAYLYRVRAGNASGYSGYVTLGSPKTCECYGPPPSEGVIGGGKKPLWQYIYKFKHVPSEKVRADVIKHLEETKKIISKTANLFEEIKRIICRKFARRFQETKMVEAVIKKPFEETSPVECTFIVSFEETQQILAPITWEFSLTIYTKIMGKITTEEKEYFNELKWL